MTSEDDVHRSSDDAGAATAKERSIVTFDRRIPMTWALGSLGALSVLLGTMYVQGNQTASKVGEMAVDVKQIRDDVQRQNTKALEDNFTLRDLQRRVSAVEMRVESTSAQVKQQQQGR